MESQNDLDQFTSALLKVEEVHRSQVEYFVKEIAKKSEENEQQSVRINHLEKALTQMKNTLTACKIKIAQQKKVISQFQTAVTSEQKPESHSPISTENVFTPVGYSSTAVRDASRTINKTCVSLFSDSASLLCTPGSTTEVSTPPCALLVQQRTILEDAALQLDEDVAEADSVGVDDTLFYLSRTFNKHRQPRNGDHNCDIPECLSDCDGDVYSNSGTASHSTTMESEAEQVIVLKDQAASVEQVVDIQTTCSGGRSLSLKVGRKLRYREHPADKHHSAVSSNTSSKTDVSPTLSDFHSPPSDFPPSVSSYCSDLTSPSLLRNSTSPWKRSLVTSSPACLSHCANISQSLFVSTPTILTEDEGRSVITTPICCTGLQIPRTDSQLSLDISDTIPPSPELCYGYQEVSSNPVLVSTGTGLALPSPKHSENEVINCQTHNESIKQCNATQRKLCASEQSTLTPSAHTDCEGEGRGPDQIKRSHIGRTLVLATPGVKPVNKMLSWESNWMYNHVQTATSTKSQKRSLNEVVNNDSESIIPQKKLHLEHNNNDKTSFSDALITSEHLQLQQSLDATFLPNGELSSPKDEQKSAGADTQENTAKCVGAQIQSVDDQPTNDLLTKKGLPTGYKFVLPVHNRAARAKLSAKACPDCNDWYIADDGIHGNRREHLKTTCRHKHLHLPPDSDPKIWDIGFPSTEECSDKD